MPLAKPLERGYMGQTGSSNSLLEAVVYAERCANHLRDYVSKSASFSDIPDWRADGLSSLEEHAPLGTDLMALRNTMTRDVGLVKSDSRLSRASRRIRHLSMEFEKIWTSSLPTRELVELRNLIICAELITGASMERRENVGLHYNIDLD